METKYINHLISQSQSDLSNKIINNKGVPGTLGCITYSNELQKPAILSNYHVLFDSLSNNSFWMMSNDDEKIFSIGKSHIGKIGNINHCGQTTFIDCGLGIISESFIKRLENLNANDYGLRIEGASKAIVDEQVFKNGGATHFTEGVVVNTHYSAVCQVNGKVYPALNQLLIKSNNGRKFCAKGDSGSVILNKEHKIIGLLWSVNNHGEGIACPIIAVMESLNISFQLFDQSKSEIESKA